MEKSFRRYKQLLIEPSNLGFLKVAFKEIERPYGNRGKVSCDEKIMWPIWEMLDLMKFTKSIGLLISFL